MPQTSTRSKTGNVEVCTATRASFAEVFLTATGSDAAAADDVFAAVAAELAARGALPIRERIYGSTAARERLLAARARQYRRAGLDALAAAGFVDGAPPGSGDFAGVQVWGITAPRGHAVTNVPDGRLWTGPGFRMLHLTSVTGTPGQTVSQQAAQMFGAAAAAATANGFSYAQTVRTWIYLARLLDWYGEFNHVRSAAYGAFDFVPPASTGIQGRVGDAECAMDALLVDGLRCRVIDRTARQGPARGYGSLFSRAVEIVHQGGTTVHVSGTASLDGNGRSLHGEHASAQCAETLLGVGAVLEQASMSLADIKQATLFCKDDRTFAACQQVLRLLEVPAFPTVAVRADVCRPELLVEMEVIACR